MKYAVILLKTRSVPAKAQLSQAFQKLYYREPSEVELASMKLDMLSENVIILVER
jgi:hypothetical protein